MIKVGQPKGMLSRKGFQFHQGISDESGYAILYRFLPIYNMNVVI